MGANRMRVASYLEGEDGERLLSDKDKLKRFVRHFESVLNVVSKVSESEIKRLDGRLEGKDVVDCKDITLAEVSDAIKQMKNGKAPGMDWITIEVIKSGGEVLEKWLLKVFCKV